MPRGKGRTPKKPSRWRVVSDGVAWVVEWKWFTPAAVFYLLFYLMVWAVLIAFVVPWVPTPGRVVFGAAAVVTGWVVLGYFVNRTTIRVSDGWLSVTHGPMYWPGGRRFAAADVTGVTVVEEPVPSEDEPQFTYRVRLSLRNDFPRTLVPNLGERAEAEYLQAKLSARLGLPAEPRG